MWTSSSIGRPSIAAALIGAAPPATAGRRAAAAPVFVTHTATTPPASRSPRTSVLIVPVACGSATVAKSTGTSMPR